ncbi:MAG: bifunctional phosphoribosylaminoimidazolecarboxamide formyltransferase/IMP cyclohydrolase, partial [Armatimonadota bacterium]
KDVVIVVDPSDYERVLAAMASEGGVGRPLRAELATRAFHHTAAYDAAITNWMSRNLQQEKPQERFPQSLVMSFDRLQSLRYGENPHQTGAFYRDSNYTGISLAGAKQLGGKELSYNNIVDLDAALDLVLEFADPACAIIKHTNPCGLAVRANLTDAFAAARAGDPISAFGGIIAFNQPVDVAVAEAITGPQTFFEAIIAPGFDPDSLPILKERKKWGANLRLIQIDLSSQRRDPIVAKKISGGLLLQDADLIDLDPDDLTVVSNRQPTEAEWSDLRFAWKAVKHAKSNAIVLVKDQTILGVGAGQMNRVGSVKIAAEHAGDSARGSVLGSDAFFPKPDGPQASADAGVTAIIQPGGSVEDANTIEVANANNMAMVMTGIRHFRH